VLVTSDMGMFVDTFDLYAAKHRRAFVVQAAQEVNVDELIIKKDLGRVLLKLEELQDEHITQTLVPKETHSQMTDEERDEALQLLRDPHLLDRIVADFEIVGERTNKLVGYLATISRKLDQPLAVIVQSSSAAGKTSLMDAVLSFVPTEDLVKYSAMTGQSLFYMGETDLQHKILAIVEEEGAERASYALKLLQSEGELTIASTGKDGSSGRLVTQEYRVQGPVMIFLTTTNIQVDEELLSRCLVLTVSEDRAQTKAIHEAQRRQQTLPGLLARKEDQRKRNLHRNAQRLLRPLLVANPYAESLTFLDDKTRTRRDHVKYLTLIRAVTLLHQYQRPVRTIDHNGQQMEYIEVTLDDIAAANQLAHEVLGRSLDELPPQTRRLLDLIDQMVQGACQQKGMDRTDYRFSRRDVREHTGWGNTQLKVHLKRLEDLEYLLVHRGGRGQSFVYELLFCPSAGHGERVLSRLIDVTQLRPNWSGQNGDQSGPCRAEIGPKSGASRPAEIDATRNGISQ
jgi:DNA primase